MTPTYTNLTLTGNRTDAVVIEGRYLARDVTLDSVDGLNGKPFILSNGANIPHGFTLTLKPGAIVKLNANQAFDVHGTLTAPGTAGQPVTLMPLASPPESNRWGRIMVYTDGALNLDHADIGYSGTANAAVEIQSSDVQIRNSTIHHSASRGVQFDVGGISPVLDSVLFEANTGQAIYQHTIDMTPTYTNLTLTGNGTDAVVIWGRDLGRDVTLDSIGGLKGLPFILTGGVNIPHGLTLTLQPGTIVKLNPSQAVDIHGTLKALGNVAHPITLTTTASSPETGRWARIMVYTDGAANLDHADIGYSGATNAAIEIQSSNVQVRNSTIHHSATQGLLLEMAAISPLFENTTIANNTGSPSIRAPSI